MKPDGIESLVIILLVLANAFFSMAEFAIITSRPTKLLELKNAGYRSAGLVLELLDNPGRLLSTLRIGIALNSIFAGTWSGVAFSAQLARALDTLPALQPYSKGLALLFIVVSVTFFSLVAGELVPKKIALRHPEAISLRIAPLVDLLCRIAQPVVWVVNGSTHAVLKGLGIDEPEKPEVTDEDVMLMIRKGAKKGVFESVEYEMISRIFRMSDKRASAIMTPRTEIEWLDLADPDEKIIARIKASGRSRFPVAEGNLDNLLGVVRSLDLVSAQLMKPGGVKDVVRASMKAPLFVPESIPAFQVLEVFRKNRAHMALVIDEHGSVQGTITLFDVLESIVGDVPADDLDTGRKLVRRSHRTWIVDGMLPVDEFATAFSLDPDTFTGEEEPRYGTMGGFMMHKLGEVPAVSDTLEWKEILFRVIKMDGQRVARLLVELKSDAAAKIPPDRDKA